MNDIGGYFPVQTIAIMYRIWTKEMEDELRRLYPVKKAKELAVHFNTTRLAIYQKCSKLGIKKDNPTKRVLTDQELIWLKLNFPHMRTELCAMRLGISLRTCVRIARSLGVEKTAQFMRECQLFAARKAHESHIANGTYPAKGWYSPNLQKGKRFEFKAKTTKINNDERKY